MLCKPFLTEEQAARVLQLAKQLERARYIDKSLYHVRKGLDNRLPQYLYCCDRSMTKPVAEEIRSMLQPHGSDLGEFGINWYRPTDFIPKHIDKQRCSKFVVIFLDSEHNVYRHYPSDTNTIEVPDKAGWGIEYGGDTMYTPHEVMPVDTNRYTLICSYGMLL